MSKTVCAINATQFLATAPQLPVTVELEDGTTAELKASPKQFSSGSFGWHCNGKVPQAPATVCIAGSTFAATAKKFSTGSTGANVNGKAEVAGLPCQVTGNLTAVGSKPGSKAKADGTHQVGLFVIAIGSKPAA